MSSSVSVTNNVFNMQPTYDALGMGPIPPGTLAGAAVAAIEKKQKENLQAGWPSSAPAFDTSQMDSGIMGPWSANVGGTAPSCVVQQIMLDFSNWELPNDPPTVTAIAKAITEQIQNNGGNSGVFYGKTRVGGSVTIHWGVAFGTAPIVDGTGTQQEEMGILFVYAAVEEVL